MKPLFRLICALSLATASVLAGLFLNACSSLPEATLPLTPFTLGLQEFKGSDSITIDEVRSTSLRFEVGDKVIVKGHYQLASHKKAKLGLYLAPVGKNENLSASDLSDELDPWEDLSTTKSRATATCDAATNPTTPYSNPTVVDPFVNPHMPEPVDQYLAPLDAESERAAYYNRIPPLDAQELDVEKGSGTFTLAYTIKQSGVLHLSFYTAADLRPFGGIYFGTEAQMAALKNWSITNQVISLVDFPFVLGPQGFQRGDSIVIQHILATSPQLGKGSKIVVRGHYQLTSRDEAMLGLYITGKSGDSTKTSRAQHAIVKKGSGDFILACDVEHPGALHVSFYGVPDGKLFGGIYFGSDANIQNFPTNPSGDRR